MPRTTSNIHRVITLAVATVATAITLSTIARAQDDDRIRGDARDIQQDRQDTANDTNKLLRDATQGGSVERDLRRLREDQQNTQEDQRRFNRDVDQRVGDPGDSGEVTPDRRIAPDRRSAPVQPNAVVRQRPQGQK
jgi:hypothetical protein